MEFTATSAAKADLIFKNEVGPGAALDLKARCIPLKSAIGLLKEKSDFSEYLLEISDKIIKQNELTSGEAKDYVASRIKQFYNREAQVIYPPVDVDRFSLSKEKEDFYLIVSGLVPYKRIDLAIEAFNVLGKKLVIIGTGDSAESLKRIAKNNIEFLGWREDGEIARYYAKCRALIFPGEEDFGIVPVEAQACGKPVIAYAKGGALETVTKDTGIFFDEPNNKSFINAVNNFEKAEDSFNSTLIRQNALRFNRQVFKSNIKKFIEEKLDA